MGYVVPHDFLFLYTKINLMARNIKLHFLVEARTPVIDMLTSLEIMQHLSFWSVLPITVYRLMRGAVLKDYMFAAKLSELIAKSIARS